MPNIKPLASMVLEENEVTNGRKEGRTAILAVIHNGIFNYSLASFGRDYIFGIQDLSLN